MIFSKRTDWDLTENDFAASVRSARAAGRELIDLTVSNPTACGFDYDSVGLLRPLSAPSALRYTPEAFGMPLAREAVSKYYADAGADIASERICLTTSTSEGYSFLFRLLCDPGDEVLIAQPSYPLFDFIAQLENVKLSTYSLVYDGAWQIDLHDLESRITSRTRAIVVVHPNNPTGNYVTADERTALDTLCATYGLALIVDEVFLDYNVTAAPKQSFLISPQRALIFVLSGISKVCALPQMKLSWIVVGGPEALSNTALARLEVIADTFLSVNAPTQYAFPIWLSGRASIQKQIRERVVSNLSYIKETVLGTHADCLHVEGGWTVVMRVPRYVNGLAFAQAALENDVVVQPGEFYGFGEGYSVLSLLTEPETWRKGLAKLPIH